MGAAAVGLGAGGRELVGQRGNLLFQGGDTGGQALDKALID